jgi:hypothetical protein
MSATSFAAEITIFAAQIAISPVFAQGRTPAST